LAAAEATVRLRLCAVNLPPSYNVRPAGRPGGGER
jgi:hypothetical protein